jgi:regulator of protease activity HflC (stomatin/prohibitin superfamily)
MDPSLNLLLHWMSYAGILFAILIVVLSNCFSVDQETVRMITRFGKYSRTATTG